MKKYLMILLMFMIIFSLSACDPNHFSFEYEELKKNVVKIELIDYENPSAKELFEKRDKVLPYDFSKMSILEVLSDEKKDDFFKELSDIVFMTVWRHLDSPKGLSIRLIYSNGDFEILSCDVRYSGSFNAEGNVKRFIGTECGREIADVFFVAHLNRE